MAVTISRSADLAAVGANAGAWTVDKGVAAPGNPASITTTPAAPWFPVGAINQTGIARNFSEKQTDLYALGIVTPYLSVITQSTATFTMELYETWRDIVKSVVYRSAMSAVAASPSTGAFTITETGVGFIDKRAWLIATMNGNAMEWFYMPSASVALTKAQTFAPATIAGIELAVTPYPDVAGNTIYHTGVLPAGVYAQ